MECFKERLIILWLVLLILPFSLADDQTYFVGDFETGDLSQWNQRNYDGGGRLEMVHVSKDSSLVRAGDYAIRTTLSTPNGGPDYIDRAEVYDSTEKLQGRLGVEKYYGFSVMIPEETVKNDGQRTRFDEDYWVIIAQWHGDDGKAPPLAVRYHKDVEGDKAEIFITGSQDRVDLGLIKSFVVDKGEWFDLVFHVVWDLGNKGYLRVWLDGEKIVDVYDQTVNSATVRGFKSHTTNVRFGGYRGNYISGAQVFYHDEYRAGNSYANVAPPGSPPVNDEPAPPPECNLIGSCTTSGGCPGTYDSSCVCVDVAGDNCPLSCSVGGSCTTGQNCAGTFNANCICQDNSGDNCPVIIPEDLNNDERVDIADLILLIRAFGSSQHDLTGDNKVDVQDLLVIIKKL